MLNTLFYMPAMLLQIRVERSSLSGPHLFEPFYRLLADLQDLRPHSLGGLLIRLGRTNNTGQIQQACHIDRPGQLARQLHRFKLTDNVLKHRFINIKQRTAGHVLKPNSEVHHPARQFAP